VCRVRMTEARVGRERVTRGSRAGLNYSRLGVNGAAAIVNRFPAFQTQLIIIIVIVIGPIIRPRITRWRVENVLVMGSHQRTSAISSHSLAVSQAARQSAPEWAWAVSG